MKKALVLGASGFLGSNIARCLTEAGYEVTGLSRSVATDERIAATGARPFRGDLSDPRALLESTGTQDAIVFAAQLMLQPEYDATATFLDMLAGSDTRFVFTSGTGVLSERTDGAWSENSFAEDEPFVPSRYIGQRLDTEQLVRAAGKEGRVQAMVIRPPLIWGHGACPTLQAFYDSADATGSVCYIGEGLNLYSNVHVDDLAEVYRLAIERGTPGALYHAVSGEVPNRFIAEEVARVLGVSTRSIDIGEAIEIWGKFNALVAMATCSRSRSPRTRRELGWTPRRLDFMGGIADPRFRAAIRADRRPSAAADAR